MRHSSKRARIAATAVALMPIAWLGAARDARGDDKEEVATESFKRASQAYAHKDFRGAALAFEAAHQVLPAGATIYNAGLAWLAAGEDLRAARDLKDGLAMGDLDPSQATDARERLATLDRRLGHVEVVGPPASSVAIDGRDSAILPVLTRVPPGVHELLVTFRDGTTASRRLAVAAGATERADFNSLSATTPIAPAVVAPVAVPNPPGSGSPLRMIGWVGVASGAALSGTAIAFGVVGLGALHDFEKDPTNQSLHDKAVNFRTYADVAWLGAALVGATGVVLVLTSHGGSGKPASDDRAAAFSIGPTGAFVSGRF